MSIRNRCKVCGRDEIMWGNTCYACKKQAHRAELKLEINAGKRDDTWGEDDVICPWCGEVIEADGDNHEVFYEEGDHEFECWECERKFMISTDVSYSYDTERIEEEADDD